jgi:hypothetical protein
MQASLVSVPVTARHLQTRSPYNFDNNMSTAAVFLGIEKAFETTWHLGFLYKLFN